MASGMKCPGRSENAFKSGIAGSGWPFFKSTELPSTTCDLSLKRFVGLTRALNTGGGVLRVAIAAVIACSAAAA